MLDFVRGMFLPGNWNRYRIFLILQKVYLNIYNNFTADKLTFGKKIKFSDVIAVINESDDLIDYFEGLKRVRLEKEELNKIMVSSKNKKRGRLWEEHQNREKHIWKLSLIV